MKCDHAVQRCSPCICGCTVDMWSSSPLQRGPVLFAVFLIGEFIFLTLEVCIFLCPLHTTASVQNQIPAANLAPTQFSCSSPSTEPPILSRTAVAYEISASAWIALTKSNSSLTEDFRSALFDPPRRLAGCLFRNFACFISIGFDPQKKKNDANFLNSVRTLRMVQLEEEDLQKRFLMNPMSSVYCKHESSSGTRNTEALTANVG